MLFLLHGRIKSAETGGYGHSNMNTIFWEQAHILSASSLTMWGSYQGNYFMSSPLCSVPLKIKSLIRLGKFYAILLGIGECFKYLSRWFFLRTKICCGSWQVGQHSISKYFSLTCFSSLWAPIFTFMDSAIECILCFLPFFYNLFFPLAGLGSHRNPGPNRRTWSQHLVRER